MFNVRRDAYDRLLIGSMGKVHGTKDKGLSRRWAQKQIARLFPSLGQVNPGVAKNSGPQPLRCFYSSI